MSPAPPAVAPRFVGVDVWLLFALAALAAYRLLVLANADLPLAPDEAQYYGWSQALDWGYYSKPPVIAAMIRLSTALFGDSEFGVRALTPCLYLFAALAIHATALRLFDRVIALRAALIFATLPLVSFGSLFATTDAPLIFFWALALAAFVRALQTDEWSAWLGLGVATGLGLLTKYAMLALPAGMALYLLWPGKQNWRRLLSPKPLAAATITLACLVPNILWIVAHGGATLRHTAEITQLDRALFHPAAGLTFLAGQWLIFGLVFAPILIGALARPRTLVADDALRLLACVTLPLFAIMTLQAFLSHANANWAAAVFVGASILVAALLTHYTSRHLLVWGLVINIILMATLYHHADLAHAFGKTVPPQYDIFWRQRGWPEFAAELQPLVAAHPDATLLVTNRSVAAELTYYLRHQSPRIAVWNPAGHISDHYRLLYDIRDMPATHYLTVMEGVVTLAPSFDSSRSLGTVHFAGRHPQDYPILLLENFKGYPQ